MLQLLIQLAPFVLLTAGSAVCASLFVSLKKELRLASLQIEEHKKERMQAEQRLILKLQGLAEELRETNERTGVLVQPQATRSGLNLSKRSQALKLSRHGETAENIAAALSLPRNEVELLMKVQKIVLSSAAPVTS